MRAARCPFLLSAFMLFFAALGLAQTSETGLPPFGTFQGSNFDVVSLENGNLHIEIPIYTVHQRALPDLRYNFVYDIAGWQIDRTPVTPTTFQWVAGPQPHPTIRLAPPCQRDETVVCDPR